MARNYHQDVFTFSFSAQTDLLSQWRGYCPTGNGYCIVCNVESIVDEIKKTFPFCSFVKCIYDNDEKKDVIREKLNNYFRTYYQSEPVERQNISQDLAMDLMEIASSFKDPTFSEEKESRLVVIEDSSAAKQLKFREGPNCLIPYLSLPFQPSAVSEIIVGPTVDKHRSTSSLTMFLQKLYGKEFTPKVSVSLTPYRSW